MSMYYENKQYIVNIIVTIYHYKNRNKIDQVNKQTIYILLD